MDNAAGCSNKGPKTRTRSGSGDGSQSDKGSIPCSDDSKVKVTSKNPTDDIIKEPAKADSTGVEASTGKEENGIEPKTSGDISGGNKIGTEFTVTVLPDMMIDKPHLKIIKEQDPKHNCVFCKTSVVDELNLGPLYMTDGVVTHYFCMLFSAGLCQRGEDKDGILGFYPDDIKKEVRRAARLKCSYCLVSGASVGCCEKRCKASFHFPCGLAKRANFRFIGNFESYCINHSRRPVIDLTKKAKDCPVCFVEFTEEDFPLVGSCCNSAIFHKYCVQQVAYNSGYFFKCSTCNDMTQFSLDMKAQGIFVPEQDAAWEKEPNAYNDLLFEYNTCDADLCLCEEGRKHKATAGRWAIARCRICGAAGTHRKCGKLSSTAEWACEPCLAVEVRTEKEKKAAKLEADKLKAVKLEADKLKAVKLEADKLEADKLKAEKLKMTVKPVPSETPPITVGGTREDIPQPSTSKHARSGHVRRRNVKFDCNGVNLNKLYIRPNCRDYFPHTKAVVQQITKLSAVLPDWRMYTIHVDLVDFLADGVEQDPSSAFPVASESQDNNIIVTGKRTIKPSAKIRSQAGSSDRRSYRRQASWQKGVVRKKRKKPAAKKQLTSSPPKAEISPAKLTPNEDDNTEKPSSSVGVLEGIRRSQQSMMSWLQPTVETRKTEVKEPGDVVQSVQIPVSKPVPCDTLELKDIGSWEKKTAQKHALEAVDTGVSARKRRISLDQRIIDDTEAKSPVTESRKDEHPIKYSANTIELPSPNKAFGSLDLSDVSSESEDDFKLPWKSHSQDTEDLDLKKRNQNRHHPSLRNEEHNGISRF